ncbi:hypothetical protein VOI54_09725 [Tamlana sp. 2201CG12-4]|uniref:hypothetical protein n=1 Tax=Tamlana sp. 2201CG12-4 TaxID=3112582 RepID=UPI002DBBF78D|nr:hypothetical protein [Tamlana sp. 2201CG12-4]MEC3907295.1 hypothetical protein [Tamlana sp. 2201CG12-4]
MKEKEDKYLDDLIKKVIKDRAIESPSFDFTNSVISQIKTGSNIIYKPLISKKGWFFILSAFLVMVIYVFLGIEMEPSGVFKFVDFSILSNNKILDVLTNFTTSKTFVYAIVLFGLMLCIQVQFLKHHFNQRYEI